ncbi:MAG: HDOD domain-containing protein [Gammaproteobacteria bacterium]|nr:HDOD domain-containing protein [Gammaproteobacteria bacterium]
MATPAVRTDTSRTAAFGFVSELARELSAGRVELPSYPDAAARLQQALADPEVSAARIALVLGTDAGLTARTLSMANSTLLHRGGKPVTDLKLAVTRIGHENIRVAALAYATAQLKRAPALAHIRADLEACWQEGLRVAALAHALARETGAARADESLLAGLLHNIGKVYILARAARDSELHRHPEVKARILRDWYPGIGQALVENWKLPEQIAAAVGAQLDRGREHDGGPELADLLTVAVALAAQLASGRSDATEVALLPAARALGLDDARAVRVVLESQTDLEMLQAALG